MIGLMAVPLDLDVTTRVLQYYSPDKLSGFLLNAKRSEGSVTLPAALGSISAKMADRSIGLLLTQAGRRLQDNGQLKYDSIPEEGDYLLTRLVGRFGMIIADETAGTLSAWLRSTVFWVGHTRTVGVLAHGNPNNILDRSCPRTEVRNPGSEAFFYHDTFHQLHGLGRANNQLYELGRNDDQAGILDATLHRRIMDWLVPCGRPAVFELLLRVDRVAPGYSKSHRIVFGSPLWAFRQRQIVPGQYLVSSQPEKPADRVLLGAVDFDGDMFRGIPPDSSLAALIFSEAGQFGLIPAAFNRGGAYSTGYVPQYGFNWHPLETNRQGAPTLPASWALIEPPVFLG